MAADARALLTDLGYAIVFREQGWVECLLVRGDERWLGRGLDEQQALDDAVRLALPSHVARVLLERTLTEPEIVVGTPTLERAAPTDANVGVLEVDEQRNGTKVTDALPNANVETAKLIELASSDDDDEDDESATFELRDLQAKIEAEADDLAVSSPQRQRLVMLAWIARARSYQERSAADEVHFGVRAIASTLGAFAREWWPGSVAALQLAARPIDALQNIRYANEPHTWEEVATLAETELAGLENGERQRGFDEFGWADADAVLPRPPHAERLFTKLVDEIEERSGQLGDLPSEIVFDASLVHKWATHLRALRGAIEDDSAWARVAGRLRYMCARNRRDYSEAASVLDPTFRPKGKWAHLLFPRSAPEIVAQEADHAARRLAELATLVNAAPRSADREAIRDWLKRALPLAADSQHAGVLERLRPFASVVLDFGAEDFSGMGRRVHKRLRMLQESLGGPPVSSTAVEPPPSVPESASTPNVHHEHLRARALVKTRGKRAVLVSNRIDRELENRLREMLELDVLDSEEADPRRVDAVVEAIGAHGYDIVLAATGFLYHTVDAKLSRACHLAGVVYVRANKARPTATLRALAT